MSEPMGANRLIENTGEPMRYPWPAGCLVQGGDRGVVIRGENAYRTAFVEAFPEDPATFLRGEGASLAEAEDACWAKYVKYAACEHGEFTRGSYCNGAGFCGRCGTFFPKLFAPLPNDPEVPPSPLAAALRDPAAALAVLELVARVDELPAAPISTEQPAAADPGNDIPDGRVQP